MNNHSYLKYILLSCSIILRCFVCINPENGTKCTKRKRINKKSGKEVQRKNECVNSRVTTFVKDLADFEWISSWAVLMVLMVIIIGSWMIINTLQYSGQKSDRTDVTSFVDISQVFETKYRVQGILPAYLYALTFFKWPDVWYHSSWFDVAFAVC